MAGHNKWSKIKRLQGALDVKHGRLFSRLSREITVPARPGGGDPAFPPRRHFAIPSARTDSMPRKNIDCAFKKGSEKLEPTLPIKTATDNPNRSAAGLLRVMPRHHHLGGRFAFRLPRQARMQVPSLRVNEDRRRGIILGAGAEELTCGEDQFLITTPPDLLYSVAEALKTAGIEPESPKLTFIPQNTVAVTHEQKAAQVLQLCDALDDLDDVMSVHANFDISENTLARLQGAH